MKIHNHHILLDQTERLPVEESLPDWKIAKRVVGADDDRIHARDSQSLSLIAQENKASALTLPIDFEAAINLSKATGELISNDSGAAAAAQATLRASDLTKLLQP